MPELGVRLRRGGGRCVVAVEVQDLRDVHGRLSHAPGLLAPCQVFAVVRLAELAMRHAGSAPCVYVPRIAFGDAAGHEAMIALPQVEVHNALFAVVGGTLEKRDHVRTAGGGSQQLLDVAVGDVVIIIHERYVLPTGDVEQCLPLRADAALAVVAKDKVFDSLPANLLLDPPLEALQLSLASRYRRGQY